MNKLETLKMAGIITEKDEKEYQEVILLLENFIKTIPKDVIEYNKSKKLIKSQAENLSKAIK